MKTWKDNLDATKKRYINWWNHKGIVVNMWEHFQEGVAPHGPYSGEQPIHLTEAARNNYGTGAFGLLELHRQRTAISVGLTRSGVRISLIGMWDTLA